MTRVTWPVLAVCAVLTAGITLLADHASALPGDFVLVTEWGEFGGSGVAKIDPDTDQIIARAAISGSPRHIAADQARRLAYVSLHYADKVAALKVDTLEVADLTIPGLGRAPIGATLTPDGLRLLVATRGDDGIFSADDRLDVVALDPTTWPPTASLVTSIPTGLHPIHAIVDRTGRYAVVTVRNQPAILVVDLTTYQVVWQVPNLPADAEPEGGDAHPTQNVVYVALHGKSTIEVLDLDLMTITQHVPVTNSTGIPTQPSAVRFTPDGSRADVSGQTVGRVLMFNTADPRNPVQDTSVELPVGPQPHDIVWLPGDRAYVANTNNMQPYGSLSVISNYSGVPSVSGPILSDLAGPLSFAYFEAATPGPTPTPTPTDGQLPINLVYVNHVEVESVLDYVLPPVDGVTYSTTPEKYNFTSGQLEWEIAKAEAAGSRISFHMSGAYAERAVAAGAQAQWAQHLANGHIVGVHFHTFLRGPEPFQWTLRMSPSQEQIVQAWQDNHDLVANLVGPEVLWVGESHYGCPTCWDNLGYRLRSTEEMALLPAGQHIVWLVERDPSGVITYPHFPQIGEAGWHGPPENRIYFDLRVPQLKKEFLMLHLEWLERERLNLEPQVWAWGWANHGGPSTQLHAAEIQEMLTWLSANFAGRTSPRGNVIAQFASDHQLSDIYEAYEQSGGQPLPSPLTNISDRFPYMASALQDAGVVANLSNGLGLPGILLFELERNPPENPPPGQPPRVYLLFRETDGTGPVDVSAVLASRDVDATSLTLIDVVDGNASQVTGSSLLLGRTPLVLEASYTTPTPTPTPTRTATPALTPTAALLTGKRLSMRDKDGNPAKRRLVLVSTDPSITAPSPGSGGDPTSGGGFLEVLNPTTGESDAFALPAANWKGSGTPPGSKGYKYTDRGLTAGPCKTAKIKDGRLDARCTGAQISFTLDGPSQGSLGLRLTLGNGDRYCLLFGGTVVKDEPGAFRAKEAPAPAACP